MVLVQVTLCDFPTGLLWEMPGIVYCPARMTGWGGGREACVPLSVLAEQGLALGTWWAFNNYFHGQKCHRAARTDACLLWAALDGVQGRKAVAPPWRGTCPPTPTGKLIILPLETAVSREGTIRLAVFTKLESHCSQRVGQ